MIKLKTILTEGFAWERKEGKGLPTMAEVKAEYDAKQLKENDSYESMSPGQLMAAAELAGMEDMIIMGYDGELENDQELIDLLNADDQAKEQEDRNMEYDDPNGGHDGRRWTDFNKNSSKLESVKPDFLDLDGDGNEKESMKSAAADSTDYGNYINKARAKSHLAKKDGSVYGIDGSGKGHKITNAADLDKYSKWTIKSDDKKDSVGWKREAENLMNVHRGSYDNSTLNDVIIDMHDAINYGIEDEDSLRSFIKKYDNTNESMNEGFVARLKKNLIGAELRK